MAVSWNSNVNTKFYGMDGNYKENRDEVEFKSGRKVYYLRNSLPKKAVALMLALDDKKLVNSKTEFKWFLYWFENTCKSGTVPFTLSDVMGSGQNKTYQFLDLPTWTGQKTKEITLTLEEV